MDQAEKILARRPHLRYIERKRLALDERTQQARFSHAFGPKHQQGFLYLRLASKMAQLLCALHATQIFKGQVALVSG
jgi:hypothetical protein